MVGDHTVRGLVDAGPGRRQSDAPSDAYFVAEFSRPFQGFGTFKRVPPRRVDGESILGDSEVEPGARTVAGRFIGVYLDLHTVAGEQVLVKVAHGQSYADAEARLRAEQPGWDFEDVHQKAEAAWAAKLDGIEVEGGTEHERMLFYSCLLHAFTSPRLIARKGERFTGTRRRAADGGA